MNDYRIARIKQAVKFFQPLIFTVMIFTGCLAHAQNGTYELKNSNGSYGLISVVKKQNHITAEIFAWWNTSSAQTGSYYGQGILINNHALLKSSENDPDCGVSLALNDHAITAKFENCTTDHLPEDFNGTYRKISEATAGDYIVMADKSFFYSRPDGKSKQKSYVVKGNTVSFNLDGGAKGNWVFVHYRNTKDKDTAGYVKLTDLEKL